LIVAVHAALLVSLWVFGRAQRVNFVAFVGYLVLQGFRFIPTMRWLPARSQYFRWFLVSTPGRRLPDFRRCGSRDPYRRLIAPAFLRCGKCQVKQSTPVVVFGPAAMSSLGCIEYASEPAESRPIAQTMQTHTLDDRYLLNVAP
jgi:hypothetical protein